MSKALNMNEALFFRDQLREARFKAQQDAEAFEEIVFALERLGCFLTGEPLGLGKFKEPITKLARRSPLCDSSPKKCRELHVPFSRLYELVLEARNNAMHGGSAARCATSHAVELALVLEDALMNDCEKISDFMGKNVVCAEMWQPLSFIRRTMLENSFSCLPVKHDGKSRWELLTDRTLAKYLSIGRANGQRKKLLLQPLAEAIKNDKGLLIEARTCKATESVSTVVADWDGQPVLVTRNESDELLGILTPYDLL
ncbi:MAG: hypothetical protein MUF81_04680 [Verrucomicrobia bacterium]|jgi:CBS domain-containing protein|nr:hypothetical protein [Verrucomicrobiota bacterium]